MKNKTTISNIDILRSKKQKPNIVIHGLKCNTISPIISHPNRYWHKDAQHFINLAITAQDNNAKLVLVNHKENCDCVKLIYVEKIVASKGITKYKELSMTIKEYNKWLSNLKKTNTII